MRSSGSDDADRTAFGYLRYAHLGTQFCALVAGGVLGGWWLDGKLGSKPIFTLVGTVLGSGYGFIVLYRSVFPSQARDETEGDRDSSEER